MRRSDVPGEIIKQALKRNGRQLSRIERRNALSEYVGIGILNVLRHRHDRRHVALLKRLMGDLREGRVAFARNALARSHRSPQSRESCKSC